jgi:cell wall assembly regulator SMI1
MTAVELAKKALDLISMAPDLGDFCGPASEADIELAERMLGRRFPDDYRMFLATLGAGNFGSQEFYGIIPGKVPGSSVPSVVWLTLDERKTADAPVDLLPVWNDGGGYQACVKIAPGSAEDGTVILVDPAYRPMARKAASFGEFLHAAIEATIEEEGRSALR